MRFMFCVTFVLLINEVVINFLYSYAEVLISESNMCNVVTKVWLWTL